MKKTPVSVVGQGRNKIGPWLCKVVEQPTACRRTQKEPLTPANDRLDD